MSDTVSCRICNKQYKRITHKHLKQHGISLSEYTEMYPGAPLLTESLRSSFASNSEAKWVKKHGEENGKRLYAKYKTMLAEKNTFEYKRDKYGWTHDQFDAYNNKRATTLANMIERYGEIDGRTKWDAYRAQQAIAGVSESWFVNKYGAEVGQQMWATVCNAKRHTLPNYITRYGTDEGIRKYNIWLTKLCNRGYNGSKPELELATCVMQLCDPNTIVYSHLTQQYCKWSNVLDRAVMYDITIPSKRVVVEFNGDYWHCNPALYSADYIHPVRRKSAAQIWQEDQVKLDIMIDQGYNVIVVWESDWKDCKEEVLKRIELCLM